MPFLNLPLEEKVFSQTQQVSVFLTELETLGFTQVKLFGNCMWPIVRQGDLVMIKKANESDLRFGDVVVRKISDENFHANTNFVPFFKRRAVSPLVGKITRVQRGKKTYDLEKRSFILRFWQALLSPANPWFLGAPSRILRLFRPGIS